MIRRRAENISLSAVLFRVNSNNASKIVAKFAKSSFTCF
jgi:hypothetical protein